MYEYPSSPSLVLHLGELDDKPKEYFEKTKKEVSRKNSLAKQVHQHKMQNVNTSDDEREIEQEYQKFKKKQNRVSSICDKKIQEFEEQDYLSLKGSKPAPDPKDEEEIKVHYVKPIRGSTLPPEYSKEISRYQPSEKERVRAMKDALSAVRQFMSEGNLSRNGNLNTTTMKEMWDYESREPFSGKIRKLQKNLEVHKQSPTMNVNCVVETTKSNSVHTKESLVWEQIPLVLTQKKNSLMVRVKV